VFEHVTRPREFLEHVSRLLKRDGLIYIKVPNALWSILKQQLPEFIGQPPVQDAWDSYEHVVHYTETTLRAMLVAAGYEPLVMTVARPVQIPVWHKYVGQYYLYPSPWSLDWKHHLGRATAYHLARLEQRIRSRVGYFAPSLVAVAHTPDP
jgi:hypothetical protein